MRIASCLRSKLGICDRDFTAFVRPRQIYLETDNPQFYFSSRRRMKRWTSGRLFACWWSWCTQIPTLCALTSLLLWISGPHIMTHCQKVMSTRTRSRYICKLEGVIELSPLGEVLFSDAFLDYTFLLGYCRTRLFLGILLRTLISSASILDLRCSEK